MCLQSEKKIKMGFWEFAKKFGEKKGRNGVFFLENGGFFMK